MILIDLAAIDEAALLEVLERARRSTASKKVVRDYDERQDPAPARPSPAKKRPAKKRAAKKR